MKPNKKKLVHFIQITISVFAVTIFLQGFLTVKPHLNTNGRVSTSQRRVDKCVLMVIDAMRLDFIQQMPFTQKSLNQSLLLEAKVHAPTVTMPRIKALTSGAIANFVDVIVNLGSSTFREDNVIEQAFRNKMKVAFYGDETWVRMFPERFVRFDATSSFYVSDYTEVDNNVTRHLDSELTTFGWDFLILHYLGLDHIGHLHGPQSHLTPGKLSEMDGIIERIHVALNAKSKITGEKYVLIVTGDHGMKDSGGHGGTSFAEAHVPFLVFGATKKLFESNKISQIDVAATISILMGLPIPSGSIGVPIVQVLENFYTHEECKRILYEYCEHLLDLARSSLPDGVVNDYYQELTQVGSTNGKNPNGNETWTQIMNYQSLAVRISEKLEAVSYKFNLDYLLIAIGLIVLTTTTSLIFVAIQNHVILLTLFTLSIAHSLTLFSSSFIEEEHQTWYFLLITAFTFIAIKSKMESKNPMIFIKWIALVACLRFIRTLNQTGDRWAHVPDFSDFLNGHRAWLTAFYVSSLILALLSLTRYLTLPPLTKVLVTVCLFFVYVAKARENGLWFDNLASNATFQAKLAFTCILLTSLFSFCESSSYVTRKQRTFNTLILFVSLLTIFLYRPHNAILIATFLFASNLLNTTVKCPTVNAILHVWLGNAFYFYQGNSNSIASIDIAPGYTMQTSYNPYAIGALIFLHTYAMQVLAFLSIIKHTCDRFTRAQFKLRYNLTCITDVILASKLLPTLTCMLSLTIHRNHLFIWSVFSPCILFASCHFCLFAMFTFVLVVLK